MKKTITRTITINTPNAKPRVIKKVITFTRTGSTNEVTGEKVFSNWTPDDGTKTGFDAFNIPSVSGYNSKISTGTADMLKAQTPSQDQITNLQDENVVIDYLANDQSMTINYVDKDGNLVAGGHFVVSGKTDQTVDTNAKIPTGWVLTPGQTDAPKTITFTGTPTADITITIEHGTKHIPHDNPVKPGGKTPTNKEVQGAHDEDLNRDVTRTINVHMPNGTIQTEHQVANIFRDATVDEVTGDVTYADWSTDASDWKAYQAPIVDSWTADKSVEAATVDENTKDTTIDIRYTANDQTTHIIYVDKDGNTVKDYTVSGKTDQTVDANADVPTGWVLVNGQTPAPKTITFGSTPTPNTTIVIEHGTRHIDHKTPDQLGTKTPTGKDVNGTQEFDLNQTITRTVTFHEPGQAARTVTQTANIFRDATVDQVTGEVTYTKWSTNDKSWTAVVVPSHVGYTTHQSDGNTVIPAVEVKDGQKNETIDVTYTANDQTGKIVYVDVDSKNTEIGHTDLVGKTDETITITPEAPAGFDIVADQNIPKSEKATANGIPTVTVKVSHHKITVKPGDEPKPGDKKPGNPDKKPGDGTPKTDISYETLHRNMIRTVNVTDPHTGLKTNRVTIHYNRVATIDDVTGDVTYGAWTVADGSDAGFDKFNIPAVPGYTSEIKSGTADELEALIPTQDQITNWTDQTVDIDYTANDQSMTIDYVDKDGNPVDGGSFTVTGKTDQTVDTDAKIPTGWVLSHGQTDAPKTITFGGTPTANIKITVEHGTKHVDHKNPIKPGDKTPTNKEIKGAHDEDLNRTVTRTINVHMPNGKVNTITQTARIYRDATIDEVTGDITYGDWSTDATNWTACTAPVVAGYTPDKSVEAVTVDKNAKDVTTDINYMANDQTMNINYVDDNNKVVDGGHFVVSGKTDQTVNTNAKIPAGWVLKEGATDAPATITFKGAYITDITVHVIHGTRHVDHNTPDQPGTKTPTGKDVKGTQESDLNQTITRTVTLHEPGKAAQTITQTAKIFRDATVDEVIGEITYGDWSTDTAGWTEVTVPEHAGYTVHQSDGKTGIPVVEVKDGQKNVNIDVTYTANQQTGKIVYVDADNNNVEVGHTDLAGKTDEDVTITPKAPAGFDIVPGQTIPATEKATADGIPTVTVKVNHHKITVKPGDEPKPGDKKPGNPNKKPGDGTPNKTISHEDLNKTITRSFTVVQPDGTSTTKKQNLSFQRIATIDDVTGDVTYSDWGTDGAAFIAETVPVFGGYTSHVTSGNYGAYTPTQDQINNWTDPNITVTYTANDQTGEITYVDRRGNTIGTTPLSGKTGEQVAIKPVAPAGWKIVDGQSILETVTATANGIAGPSVLVEHNTITVNPGDKKPGNPNKKPGDGTPNKDISYEDLHKSTTRTITIHDPHNGDSVDKETINFNRIATIDDVNGDVTYGDWTVAPDSAQDRFNNVTYPVVPGYSMTATPGDHSAKILSQDDINNWTDPMIEVSYAAQDQSGKISYVGPDGQEVAHTTLTGKTDSDVDVKNKVNIPTNWKIVPGQTIPDTIKAGANVTINIEHDSITVTPDNPKTPSDKLPDGTDYPKGVDQNDLNKTITRTINIIKPGEITATTKQQTKFHRSATIDLVNHKITYTDWAQNGSWTAVDVPAVDGYTPSVSSIDEVAVTPDTQDTTVNVTYTANDQNQVVNYVDDSGKVINSETIPGKTGDNVKINVKVPDHYVLVPGQSIPTDVTLKSNNPAINIKVTPKLDPITNPALLSKTITRTITINKPKSAPQVITQEAKFTRTGNTNEVTGEQTFSDWTLASNDWTEVDAPVVPGYTPSQSKVEAVNVTPDMTDTTATINYLTNAQTGKISYVDGDGNEVSHTDLAGHTGDTININPQAPTGWKIMEGQNIPKTVVAGPDGIPTVTVKVEHDTITVTPDQPKDPSDKMPDGKNYPSGVTKNDLNKTISRKITINVPNKPAQVINQKADFTRTATINLVNHDVTYSDWTMTDNTLNGVDVPVVPGYTASQSTIDGITNPTVNTKLSDITVNYTANEQGQVVNYVDPSGKTVKSDTVPGHTGETVDITVNVPDHYTLVPGQTIPSHVTLTDNNNPITVQVTPKIDNITDPAKLNKTISRTITINIPGQKPQIINQSASFTRTGTHNEVTGEDNFSNWTLKNNGLTAVTAPEVDGYTAKPASVEAVNSPTVDTKLQNVTINYTANEQGQVINYVDDNGKTVKTDTVNGKTGDNVKITINVPDHYVLVPGQSIPTDVTLTTKNTPITVKVTPKLDDVTDPAQLNKTITRKITVNVPGKAPQVINQTATFTRTGKTNEVTGETTYTDWKLNNNGLTDFKPEEVAGYTPTIKDVPAVENPTADQKFDDINITYTANDQTQVINYVDPSGKTGDKVDINVQVPDNYVIVPGQEIPTNVTLKDKNTPINVQVTPKMDPVTDPAQLNKTISRTITINVPGQKPQVINQSASFTRTGETNEVTGKTTYTDWKLNNNGWTKVDVPAVPGYQPNVSEVPAVDVTPDTKSQTVNITYTANENSQVINYVDDNGKTVKTDTVSGKTGETVKITPNVPDHYILVPGQTIPGQVTFTGDQTQPITVKVTPKIDDVTDPAQLNKKVTRKITVIAPNGMAPKTIIQVATFARTGKINEVTGETTYTDWKMTSTGFPEFTPDNIPGYTPSIKVVPAVGHITADQHFDDITITYTANENSQVINYVDDNGKTVKTDTVTGKTGETVKITPNVPDHYVLVPGQKIPSDVTITGNNPAITIKVTPKMDPVTDPSQLTKTITRKVTITTPDGKTTTKTQTATFTRTGETNEVTGETTFTDWTLKDNGWTKVDVPDVPGYKPNVSEVPAVNVTPDTKSQDVDITYTANEQSQVINYVDEDGNIVDSNTVSGKTGETVAIKVNVPENYDLVPGQKIPSEVTLTTNNPTITVKVTSKTVDVTDPAKLNKSISRKITINVPGQKPQVITQTATFTRTSKLNLASGIAIYTPWVLKDNGLKTINAPEVAGYTPSQKTVAGIDNPEVDTKLNDVVINYTANDQTQVINYVDENGKVVKTDKVTGKTGETVKIPANVPDHYELVPGQSIPENIKLTDHNPAITVKVTPKMDPVTDPAKLTKTISRTITINKPGEKPQVITQTATFKRTGKINEVNGATIYTPWVLDQNGLTTVSAPEVSGYTPSQKAVDAIDNPTVNTKLNDVNISYTANEGTVQIKYVDRNGNEIGRQVITGHVGDTVKVTPQIPEDWVPVDPDTVPAEVQIKEENGQIIIVVVRHGEKDPVQTKNVTRTIKVTTPDGQTKTIKQVATISRHGELDLVTGQITWQPWTTAQWDVFKPAVIAGYTPSPAEVPAVTVDGETTDQTVVITYTAVATPAQPDSQLPADSNTSDNHAADQKADNDAQPEVTNTASQQTANTQQTESTTSSHRLPQTGNSHDASALAGLGLVSLMGMFGLGSKRRKHD
ncbi:MAG: MucBP domain-containing protein [Lactobacillaceae bacterium]|nr:MucBP domain-containing protein [Lactobacillaceae bacterium]